MSLKSPHQKTHCVPAQEQPLLATLMSLYSLQPPHEHSSVHHGTSVA